MKKFRQMTTEEMLLDGYILLHEYEEEIKNEPDQTNRLLMESELTDMREFLNK